MSNVSNSTAAAFDNLTAYLETLVKSARARERNQLLRMCDQNKRQHEWVAEFVRDGAEIKGVTSWKSLRNGGLQVADLGSRLVVPGQGSGGGDLIIDDLSPAGLRYAEHLIQKREREHQQENAAESMEASDE